MATKKQEEIIDLSALTDDELLEYEKLLDEVAIDQRWESMRVMSDKTPKNYRFLFESYYNQKYIGEELVSGFKGVVLEGSARSAKTFSALKFIIKVCTDTKESLVVNIVKETYNEFKTTLYKDFRVLLDELALDNPFNRLKEVDSFKINNSYINFIGADNANKIHGNTSDIIYFNEVLPIDEGVFRQSIMRCSKFWIIDYNPSVTEHWVYDRVIPRPDVGYLRTTFKDNPLIPLSQKLEIMAYEPYEPGSYTIVGEKELHYNGAKIDGNNQPPKHPKNVDNGTADLFMWMVYGLGLRGAMRGTIFQNIRYVDKSEVPDYGFSYGCDFGFTADPTVLTRYWEDDTDIYAEVLSYSPIDNPDDLEALFERQGVDQDTPITCDSSDKYTGENKGTVEMVQALRDRGYKAFKVSKTKGIMFWINSMKRKRINIVKNDLSHFAQKEAENYRFKEINGMTINQPNDKYNHFWDSVRYAHIAYNNSNINLVSEWS